MDIDEAVRLLLELYPSISIVCRETELPTLARKPRLTSQQREVLRNLDNVRATSLNALARRMGVTDSTMSIAVDRLERRGLVSRQRSPADRRSVQIRLTPAGSEIEGAQGALSADRVRRMLLQLEPEERDHGLYGLWLLGQAANRLGASERVGA